MIIKLSLYHAMQSTLMNNNLLWSVLKNSNIQGSYNYSGDVHVMHGLGQHEPTKLVK